MPVTPENDELGPVWWISFLEPPSPGDRMHGMGRRRFAIRFEPPGNGHAVPLDVFTDAIVALAAGLNSLKNNFSPHWAERIHIKKAEADRQLAINLLPSEPGSFVQPVALGYSQNQQDLAFHNAEAAFMHFSGKEFEKFITDQSTSIFSIHVGECFLRAGEVARKKNIELSISEQRTMPSGTRWKPIIPVTRKLTELQKSLTTRKEKAPRQVRKQIVGQIDSLNTHPLFMMLRIKGSEPIRISLNNEIKTSAHALWGKQALVTVVGREAEDGKIVDATALRIKELVAHEDPVQSYMSTAGTGKSIWDTEPAQEYVKLLRGRE
jgi:hypothetical protein